MNYKKLFLVIMSSCLVGTTNAKPAYSGDIVGRDLAYPGMGWLGHVGIATGDNVGNKSDIIIETLNENPVVQISSLSNFKSRSAYWGSRYGIGDYQNKTLAVLVEANHQRWWCPKYTSSTAYVIGAGNPNNGTATKCGVWRCDTFVAWSFFSAGYYQLMNNAIMLPKNVFNTFPYGNNELHSATQMPHQPRIGKNFINLSADELNRMSYDEFVMVADIPLNQETPTHIEAEWKYAKDHHVNEIKRGIFIDRLSMSDDKNVIPRFLSLYKDEQSAEIRSKLLQGTVIYYQNHLEQIKSSLDYQSLKEFYTNLLNKKISAKDADNVIRGYIDFHSSQEILANRLLLDKQLLDMEPHLALGLKNQLGSTSKELEEIYIPSMITMLKNYNRSDLDDMFFGIMRMNYQNLSNHSKGEVKAYLDLCTAKYLSKSLSHNDAYFGIARKSFIEFRNILNTHY